jgi:protein SCO1/2
MKGRLMILLFGALLIVVALYLQRKPAASPLPVLGTVGDFELVDEQGQPFTAARFHNRVSLLDFIFTSCAGPCPLMSARMQALQDSLKDLPVIQLVSFSVDPETDTPQVLRDYGLRFSARPGRWYFLTGRPEEMFRIIRTGFHLTVAADTEGILHSTKFVLLDRRAGIRGYYDSEDDSSMARLVADTRMLVDAGE